MLGARSLPSWAPFQGALLIAMAIVLIQPTSVPDPFGLGAALSWTAICLVAALPTLVRGLQRLSMPPTRLDPYLWAYVICCAVVLPFSADPQVGVLWLLALVADLLIFYAVVAAVRSEGSVAAVLLLIIVLGTSALQLIALDYHLEQGILTRIAAYDRPEGWGGYPELGFLACVQLAILVGLFQTTVSRWRQFVIAAVVAVSLVELLLLYSRLAWVTTALLFLVASVFGRPLRAVWKPALATVGVAMLMGLLLSQTDTGSRLVSSLATRALSLGRLDLWERTAKLIGDHPLTGVGAGRFQAVFEPIYNPLLNNDLRRGGHAHNLWLQQAAERGLVAAVAYAALWLAVIAAAARQRNGSWIHRAAFLVVIVVALRSMGDYMFFSTGGAPARLHTLLWVVWGIVGAETFTGRRPDPMVQPIAAEATRS